MIMLSKLFYGSKLFMEIPRMELRKLWFRAVGLHESVFEWAYRLANIYVCNFKYKNNNADVTNFANISILLSISFTSFSDWSDL